MASLYEKVQRVCSLGHHAIVTISRENEYPRYYIVSPFKDVDGDYRQSTVEKHISICETRVGVYCGSTKKGWIQKEEDGHKYVGIWHPEKHIKYKEGDKVRIAKEYERDEIDESEYWRKEKRAMIGKEYALTRDNECGAYYDINGYYFKQEYLEPVFDEETEELTLAEICKELGRCIKIIK